MSDTTPVEFDNHEAPLIAILNRSPNELSDAELEAHINKLHSLRTSHHETKKATATPGRKAAPKISADLLNDLLS